MAVTGARLFTKALAAEGVEIIFAYPGGYAIQLFDELYKQNEVRLVLPRHEQALVHEADGYARSTGKVGVCLVTSGPGATNTITGLATANFDSVPIVCFTGQVPIHQIGNDAFQEADVIGLTNSIVKHNFIVSERKDLGRIIKEAFHIARSGRPGVVVVDLPVNVVKELGDDTYPSQVKIRGYKPNEKGHKYQIRKACDELLNAKKPVFLIGGGVNNREAGGSFTELVSKLNVPVISSLLGIGAIACDNEKYVGMLGMHGCYAANKAVCDCDLLFAIGTRFNDRITGQVGGFAKNARIVHIDIDPAAISRNITVDLPIVGDTANVIQEMRLQIEELTEKIEEAAPYHKEWLGQIMKWKEENPIVVVESKKLLSPMKVIRKISEIFPDAIITTDVGQHQMWTAQFGTFRSPRSLLTSGGLGTMGFGLPSAIGAQLGNPGRRVVNISGDGGFQMNSQELATAVIEGLPLVICVFNNNYLGMVRQWQGLFYDKRYSGTCLRRRKGCPLRCNWPDENCPEYTPNFVKLAEAYGAAGIRVTEEDAIAAALLKAKEETGRPTLIEFMIEREYNVFPMVPSGGNISDMLLEEGLVVNAKGAFTARPSNQGGSQS